jgi:hypothetical protein
MSADHIGDGNPATPTATAPARVEYGDPARLIGLMLNAGLGDSWFDSRRRRIGDHEARVCSVNWNCWR